MNLPEYSADEVLKNCLSPTAIVDKDLRYVMVSESWLSHYEMEESQVLNTRIFDLFPNIESYWKDILNECLQGKIVIKEDTTVVKNNSYRMLRKIAPWKNNKNNIAGLVITLDELSFENKLQEALNQSINRFKSAFELSATGMAIVSPEGQYLEVNAKLCKILGYTEKELLEKKFSEITYPEDLEYQINNLEKLMKGEIESSYIEKRYIHKDGHIIWVHLAVSLLKDVKNNPIHFISQIIDRTDAKKAEEEIRKSKETLQRIMDETPDIICNLSYNGDFLQINKASKFILGYEPEELIGKNISEIILEEDMEEALNAAAMAISGTNLRNIENRSRKKDGTVIPLLTSMRVDPTDNTIFAIVQDASEKKEAERKFKQLNIQLEKRAQELYISNKYLEEFAFVASHDLQEPLRTIRSFLELLVNKYEDIFDPTARKYINFAVDASERMQKMILGLLEYSTVGKTEKKFEYVDLNEIMKEAISLNHYKIENKNASIIFEKLPVINGIRAILLQLFHNLISNSLKYQEPDTRPEINVTCTEENNDWKFSFKDNGIGIDQKYNDKIFILFQRLHTKSEYSGSGIGLAMCKRIIENHRGKIWIESRIGEGTTFHFTLSKEL